MTFARPALISVVVVGMLALAGCSSPAPDDSSDSSPLSEYFKAFYGGNLSEQEQQEKTKADDRAREDLVAKCMTAQGFEYKPAVQSYSLSTGSQYEYEPEKRDWVSQYGYGMVNYPGRDEAPTDSSDQYVDPNSDYVQSLSESEQAAYWDALNGPMPSEDEAGVGGSYEYDWSKAGCNGAAQHELQGEDPLQSDEHKPLMDALNAFYEQAQNAPELADLDAAWASCMSDAGYPGFAKQPDAQNSLNEEMNKIYESPGEQGVDHDDPRFAELGKKEIELALADLDCREKTDYRTKAKQVTDKLEQQFVDDHKAELEALKADVEQGR